MNKSGRYASTPWVVAVVMAVVAAVLAGYVLFDSRDSGYSIKKSAVEAAHLGQFISPEDVRWIGNDVENSGSTTNFYAVVRDVLFNGAMLGNPEGVDSFVVRDELPPVDGAIRPTYRRIAYFRESRLLASRHVHLLVGLSNVDRALAG